MFRRNWRSIFIFITFVFDVLAIFATGRIAYAVRNSIPNLPPINEFVFTSLTGLFGLVVLFACTLNGVYRSAFHIDTRQQYFLAGKAYLHSSFVILILLYFFQQDEFPRRFTLLFFLFLPVLFIIGRSLLNNLKIQFQRIGFGIHQSLLVGYDRSGLHFIDSLEGMREIGYGLRGVIVKKLWPGLNELRIDKKYIPAYPLTNLEAVIDDQSIDRLFVPNSAIISNGYADLLRISQKFDIKLKVLSRETTQLLRKANVYDIAGISLYYPPRPTVEFLRSAIKRLVDIVASAVLLLILSPVFAITAAAIFVESGRPIFFKQLRSATKEGKQFHFFKFRSMIKNADELKESLFQHNEATGVLFKMRDDPRMTTVGRFIRKFSIDELPQLLNVLVGDMSLVGPRPLPASDFAKSQETDEFRDSAQDRGKVKPGMTGLWQISGRSNIGFREMLLLDLYYVENNSLLFDLEILFSTIPVVLFGKGSY